MSKIKISELRPVGSELFQDSESYLYELSESEVEIIGGAVRRGLVITSVIESLVINSQISASIGISLQSNSLVSVL